MHDFVIHILKFILEHGFYGRASEESFESYHVRHKRESSNLKSMKNNELRSDVLNRRLQGSIDPRNEAVVSKIRTATTGPLRGPYNTAERYTSLPVSKPQSFVDGDNIILHNDRAIKKDWEPVFRMVVAGEVPDAWRENFSRREDINHVQKAEGTFSCFK